MSYGKSRDVVTLFGVKRLTTPMTLFGVKLCETSDNSYPHALPFPLPLPLLYPLPLLPFCPLPCLRSRSSSVLFR